MSLLKDCDECNMTCCPNYNPYRLPKDIGKIRAREAMKKIRENVLEESRNSIEHLPNMDKKQCNDYDMTNTGKEKQKF